MYFRQERNITGKVSSVNNLYWTNIRTSVDSFNRENRIALLRYLRYKMRHFPWGGCRRIYLHIIRVATKGHESP